MISIGPTCQVPGCMCPPWKDRLCSGHWRLQGAFGHETASTAVTRFDVLKAVGQAHDADSPEFERGLHEWLAE